MTCMVILKPKLSGIILKSWIGLIFPTFIFATLQAQISLAPTNLNMLRFDVKEIGRFLPYTTVLTGSPSRLESGKSRRNDFGNLALAFVNESFPDRKSVV